MCFFFVLFFSENNRAHPFDNDQEEFGVESKHAMRETRTWMNLNGNPFRCFTARLRFDSISSNYLLRLDFDIFISIDSRDVIRIGLLLRARQTASFAGDGNHMNGQSFRARVE